MRLGLEPTNHIRSPGDVGQEQKSWARFRFPRTGFSTKIGVQPHTSGVCGEEG